MTLNSLLLNDWKVPGQELGIIFQFYLRIFLVKSRDCVDKIATARRKMSTLKFIIIILINIQLKKVNFGFK